ncbi:MAG: TetR family transcriptional regulator [Anaerolineae bacterium]|nr:TetR family transcriptional regulator [Anaerolineae bacterium]
MASVSCRERELQARRAAVLLAAGRLFTQQGFEGTTMAEIARQAEVSVGTIYQLFESKDALQMALLEEKAGRLLAQAEIKARALPTEPGGVQRLAGIELLLSEERPEVWLGKKLSRREREIQSKRRDILDAAAQVFIGKGFYEAAMADIAEEAGVATGTLYNFFPSKEELYFTLIEEKADDFLLYLQMEVNGVSSAVEKITRLIQAECSFFEANRAFFRIYISTRSGFEWAVQEDLGERIHDKYTTYLNWVAGILEAGMQEGVLRAMAPKEMAQALVGMLNASIFEWMVDGNGQPLAARAPRIAELFLKGAERP